MDKIQTLLAIPLALWLALLIITFCIGVVKTITLRGFWITEYRENHYDGDMDEEVVWCTFGWFFVVLMLPVLLVVNLFRIFL
ncbi:MAG: hypothetical protein AAB444_02495 [Patescibacteria group bacterium]